MNDAEDQLRRCRRILHGAIQRCHNPNGAGYVNYGGRGIFVCDEWRGPGGAELFFAHIGPRPSPKHSVDRIDNNRGYEPGNVRWATMLEQAQNKRRSGRLPSVPGGRPHQLVLRIGQEDRRRLDRLCAVRGESVSDVIRWVITSAVKELRERKAKASV